MTMRQILDIVRVLLLRVLIGWWAIPAMWLMMWPLGWLTSGDAEETTDMLIDLSNYYWNGFPKNL
jgi:hypothetical protein